MTNTKSEVALNSCQIYQNLVNYYQWIAKPWGFDIFRDDFKVRWKLIAVIGYIIAFIVSTGYICASNTDNPIRILKSITFLAVSFQMLVKLSTLIYYINEIKKCHQCVLVTTKNCKDQWGKSLLSWNNRFKVLAKVFILLYSSSASLFVIYPIYAYSVHREKHPILDFVIPFVNENTRVGYSILMIAQFFQILNSAIIIFLSDMIFFYLVFFAGAYEELVEHDCKYLTETMLNALNVTPDRFINQVKHKFNILLVDAIKRHKEMDEYIDKIKLIFEKGCLVQISCIAYTLMLSLVVIKVTDWFVIYLFVLAYFTQLIIFSSIGTLLESKTGNLSVAIWNIPWYYLTVSDQKMFMLFLKHSQSYKQLYLIGKTSLNVETGLKVMKTIYSAYIMIENFY